MDTLNEMSAQHWFWLIMVTIVVKIPKCQKSNIFDKLKIKMEENF